MAANPRDILWKRIAQIEPHNNLVARSLIVGLGVAILLVFRIVLSFITEDSSVYSHILLGYLIVFSIYGLYHLCVVSLVQPPLSRSIYHAKSAVL
jgi:hypothetical protein